MRKRNASEYDAVGSISRRKLKIFFDGPDFKIEVVSWLQKIHPEIYPGE